MLRVAAIAKYASNTACKLCVKLHMHFQESTTCPPATCVDVALKDAEAKCIVVPRVLNWYEKRRLVSGQGQHVLCRCYTVYTTELRIISKYAAHMPCR